MEIKSYHKALIRADIVSRYIPGVSTISSLVKVIIKAAIKEDSYQKNPYFFYLSRQNSFSLFTEAVPVLGNFYGPLLNSLFTISDGADLHFLVGGWHKKQNRGNLDLCLHSSVNNKEFIRKAITRYQAVDGVNCLKHAGFNVIHDKAFISEMIQIDHKAFLYAAKTLQRDVEVIKSALHKDLIRTWRILKEYKNSNELLQNDELKFEALKAYLKLDPEWQPQFPYLYEETYPLQEDVQQKLVSNNSDNPSLKYALKEDALVLAAHDGLRIAFMPKELQNDREIALTAYIQNPKAIDFVENSDLQSSLKALKIFAMIILQAENLLELKKDSKNMQAERFFKIAGRLPLDLQIVMANVASGSTKETLSKGFDPMVRSLSYEAS